MKHSWTLTIIHFLEPIIFILNIFNFIIKSQNIIDDTSFVFPGSLKTFLDTVLALRPESRVH